MSYAVIAKEVGLALRVAYNETESAIDSLLAYDGSGGSQLLDEAHSLAFNLQKVREEIKRLRDIFEDFTSAKHE